MEKLTILDAAHTIRFHLGELLDADEAETLEHNLDALLKKAESDILALLCGNDITRKWTDEFLNAAEEVRKSYSGLPGVQSQASGGMLKYICPERNCTEYWYSRDADEDIPECPKHNKNLIKDRS